MSNHELEIARSTQTIILYGLPCIFLSLQVAEEGSVNLTIAQKNVTLSPSLYYHRLISAADILAATTTANEVPDDS